MESDSAAPTRASKIFSAMRKTPALSFVSLGVVAALGLTACGGSSDAASVAPASSAASAAEREAGPALPLLSVCMLNNSAMMRDIYFATPSVTSDTRGVRPGEKFCQTPNGTEPITVHVLRSGENDDTFEVELPWDPAIDVSVAFNAFNGTVKAETTLGLGESRDIGDGGGIRINRSTSVAPKISVVYGVNS